MNTSGKNKTYAVRADRIEDAGRRFLLRVYEGGKNTASDVESLERELAAAMLNEFENSLKILVRG